MATLPRVRKMPLSTVSIPVECSENLRNYFVDIIERNAAHSGLHEMLLEAYVLGMHHCMTVCEVKAKE